MQFSKPFVFAALLIALAVSLADSFAGRDIPMNNPTTATVSAATR